jgi:hypothetical protein
MFLHVSMFAILPARHAGTQHRADETLAAMVAMKSSRAAGSRKARVGDDVDPPYDPCTEDYVEVYLNRPDVRTKIPDTGIEI